MSRVSSIVLSVFAVCAIAPAAFGQIIYEPVQYQHRSGNSAFYYGGSNPGVIYWAHNQQRLEDYGRVGRQVFGRPWAYERFNQLPHIYSDYMPYQDVALLGATPDDARNEALRSIPRYFRKIDLLREGIPMPDGTVSIPANAPQIQRYVPRTRVLVPPGTNTQPVGRILIIPKGKKPITNDATDKLVASAS